ncbi:hypothetical protein BHM03_00048135 [Ensete ventricosum]|nr:hypothetical protein BHM03_00048135 [Ensete ventricosum]
MRKPLKTTRSDRHYSSTRQHTVRRSFTAEGAVDSYDMSSQDSTRGSRCGKFPEGNAIAMRELGVVRVRKRMRSSKKQGEDKRKRKRVKLVMRVWRSD